MKRPKVIINVASSLDGFIASNRGALHLSSREDLERVHLLRNSVDAILVGKNTVIIDNPLLTVRYTTSRKKHPLRIILDSKGSIPIDSNVVKEQKKYPTVIFVSRTHPIEKEDDFNNLGVTIIPVGKEEKTNFLDLKQILKHLKNDFNVKTLLVEGGSTIISQFIQRRLVDKMFIYFAPILVGHLGGIPLLREELQNTLKKAMFFKITGTKRIGDGILVSMTLLDEEKK